MKESLQDRSGASVRANGHVATVLIRMQRHDSLASNEQMMQKQDMEPQMLEQKILPSRAATIQVTNAWNAPVSTAPQAEGAEGKNGAVRLPLEPGKDRNFASLTLTRRARCCQAYIQGNPKPTAFFRERRYHCSENQAVQRLVAGLPRQWRGNPRTSYC
jgi:hypothetical protein